MDEMQIDLHNNAVGRAAGEAGTYIDISKLQTSPNPDVTIPSPYK